MGVGNLLIEKGKERVGDVPEMGSSRPPALWRSKTSTRRQIPWKLRFFIWVFQSEMAAGRAQKPSNGVSMRWVSLFCVASFFLGVLVVNRSLFINSWDRFVTEKGWACWLPCLLLSVHDLLFFVSNFGGFVEGKIKRVLYELNMLLNIENLWTDDEFWLVSRLNDMNKVKSREFLLCGFLIWGFAELCAAHVLHTVVCIC